MPKRPYPKWHRRHDAILLYLMSHPVATNKEIAEATGYSPSQVSRIMCSPDFEARYETLYANSFTEARLRFLRGPAAGPT